MTVGAMPIYNASCHCGAVRYRFLSDIRDVVACNCSYCIRKAALHHRIGADRFHLLQGEDSLSQYQFGTMRATHFFCRECGTHTHCFPRSDPEQINVNIRCVEHAVELLAGLSVRTQDGRAWKIERADLQGCTSSSSSQVRKPELDG